MSKTLYIIPGWEETTRRRPYQLLRKMAQEKGYEVVFKNVDWKKPLSGQIFDVPENAVIFGFSLGAILAWLVAQNKPCRHLILASMTPHYSFTDSGIKKSLVDLAGVPFVEDVISHLKIYHQAQKQTTMYGAIEGGSADILVPDTEHELTANYIKKLEEIL